VPQQQLRQAETEASAYFEELELLWAEFGI
jgi:hypothetical protein